MTDIQNVLKEFKSSALEKAIIDLGGLKMNLAGETRWCSFRDSFRCLLKNLEFMPIVAAQKQNKVKQSIKNLLIDDEFEMNVVNSVIVFDPICTLINKFHQSDCTIGEAAELWLTLTFSIDDIEIEAKLQSRLKKVINPVMLAANFLHSQYQGEKFVNNYEYGDMVNEFFFKELTTCGMDSLCEYKQKIGVFRQLFNKEIKSPGTFWSLAMRRHPELSNVALKLAQMPVSTARLERLFSIWSHVHNPSRNRLVPEKSKKLLDIYYTLKMTDINESSDY